MKTLIAFPFVALLACILAAPASNARIWHVNPEGTGDAPTIQAGIDSAVAGEVVEVACGTYYAHLIDPEHPDGGWACVVMKSGITLRSETGEADCVTLDAQGDVFGSGRIGIYCDGMDDTTVIEGFLIINGTTYGSWGGGIHCRDSSPTVKKCTFSNNKASGNATFAGGGGMKCLGSSWPTIIDCVFSENVGDSGDGGGLQAWSNCTVINCTFTGNSAEIGGGVSGDRYGNAVLTLDNCLFVGNRALSFGGGIGVFSGSVSLSNCTITDNEAVGGYGSEGGGGGIFVGWPSGALAAFNTDILNNIAPDGPDGHIWEGSTALLTCSDIDLEQWFVEEGGTLILDNEGCGVTVEVKTWGGVKALYK